MKILNKYSEKILKYLIDNHNTDSVDINEIYDEFGTTQQEIVIASLEELQLHKYIQLIADDFYECGEISLLPEGRIFFNNKKNEHFRFWFPVVISNTIAVAALIVAILAYIKQ